MLRYYLYISDAKVDMLLSQIGDARVKTISSELGFSFKLFSAKRTEKYDDNVDRVARLEVVLAFIRRFGNLGTVDSPDEYIEDSLPMRSVFFDKTDTVYFSGSQGNTVVGLGGSKHHLIGAGPSNAAGQFSSLALTIWVGLTSELEKEGKNQENRMPLDGLFMFDQDLNRGGLPSENLRFMAKRLSMVTGGNNQTGILGTPLYVTKED